MDVINLGKHRLYCGDATKKTDVEKLIGNHEVNLLLTDPPYGIDIVKTNTSGGGGSWTQGRSNNHTIQRQKEQSEEENLQHSKYGTVGIASKPGFALSLS